MSKAAPRIVPTKMGPKLAETVRQLVTEAKSDNPLGRVTVVTPSFYSAFYLRRALAPGGLFNVEFARLDELAEMMAADALRERGSRSLTRLQASQLVHAAVTRALYGSTPLGRIRDHDATQRALHRTFTEMSALGDEAASRLPRDRHFADLASTFRAYRELSRSFHDRREVAELAVAVLRQTDYSIADQFGKLVVVLAEAPPPQYRPLWEALVQSPGTLVAIGLTGDSEADALVTRPLAEPIVAPDVTRGGLPKLVSAPSRTDEIKAVVRHVMASARKGVRFGQIAVLFADPSYGARLCDAFDLAGIPTCGPDPSVMAQTSHGRFLDGIFRILDDDFSRESVTNWLTSAPVRNPATGQEAPAARWDAISRAAGITAGKEAWRRRLRAYAESREARSGFTEDDEPSTAEVRARSSRAEQAQALAAFIEMLLSDLSRPVSTWDEVKAWLKNLLDKYLCPDITDAGERRREWLERLADRIGSLSDTGGIEPPTIERLATIVRDELDRPLRTSRSLGSGVFVGSTSDAVACVFDTVHIVGMREGLFPPPDRVDPLLPDDAREILDPTGADLPGRRTRQATDRRRFLAAAATASNVVLYWPRSEGGSVRESAPAPWFVEQARRYDGSQHVQAGDLLRDNCPAATTIETEPTAEGMPDAAGDLPEYDIAAATLWRRSGRTPRELPLPNEDRLPVQRALALMQARGSNKWTHYDGNLSGISGGFAAPAGPFSPTRFEKYAACPFRYFLGELVAVEPTEKPEDQLALPPLARGRLVHQILEAFVKDRGSSSDVPMDAQHTQLEDIAQIEFRRFERDEPTGHPALWQLEQRTILRNLGWWLEAEARHLSSGNWQAHLVEQEFGTDNAGSLDPVRIDLDDGRTIEFRGVIDRVDISSDESRAALFDYKTGRSDGYRGLDKDPVLRGTKLQLVVYGAAIQQAYPSVGEIDSNYWFVFDDNTRQLVPGPGKYDQRDAADELRKVADVVSSGISSGAFPARPGGTSYAGGGATFENCAYCEYDRVCTVQRQRQWARKRVAPALARYVTMTRDLEGVE